ncbi:hypothetical protein [Nonomuraea sp. NPDC050643]|uniref:hypothetical protein n=1 Tax=Nonomuraea sp. NPDC050643 TaxID=3155660 RepID=UPI00340A5DBB
MADQGVPVAGAAARPRRGWDRVAWAVTEVFFPVNVVLALLPVLGLLSDGWPGGGWGLAVSLVCAGVPGVVIARGVRRGRLDSRHIVERRSRRGPMLAALAAVVAALAALLAWDGPWPVTGAVVVMLGWIATLGPITAVWKISFHAAVAAGAVVMLAYVLPAAVTLAVGGVVVAVIGWARVRITHHTVAQVLAGATVGAGVAWAVFALL